MLSRMAGCHSIIIEQKNCIRPFAIGRRNWLFSDTQDGAHASTVIYSIVTTAKGNALKPREYLTWLLEELPKTQGSN
jgi:hypothetical protein